MKNSWRTLPVVQLIAENALIVEDGNHGEYRPRPEEFRAKGVAFIRAADMHDGVIDFAGAEKIGSEALARIRKGIGRPRDVLLSHKGTVGKVAIAPDNSPDYVCSPQTTFWRSTDPTVLHPRYLKFYLESRRFQDRLSERKGESDMAPYVSLTAQKTLLVDLPPIGQQTAIAQILGALDDKIAANARISDTLEDILAEKFAQMNVDALHAPDADIVRMSDLFELNPRTPAPSEARPVYLDMQKLPTKGMTIASWSHREARGGARFRNGDTLVARITPCLENRKTGYVDFLTNGSVGIGSTEYIVVRSKAGVPNLLSYFLAVSTRFREFAIRRMAGTSGRQRVSAADVGGFELVRPTTRDLTDFDEVANPLIALSSPLRDENWTLASLRDTLLPQLMSGKLRVKDAEKQVEEVV